MQKKENLVKTTVFLIILCFLCFVLSNSYSFSSVKNQKKLTPTQKWALAAGAILTEANNESHDLLGGVLPDPATRESYLKSINEWWGIHDRKTALATLDWLIKEGHRKEYEKLVSAISKMSKDEYKEFTKRVSNDKDALSAITFVKKYHKLLGNKSLIAWDFCRYINLTGWCYVCGYITENEAWERIIPAAKKIQKTYNSWEDMGKNYLIGRIFWNGEAKYSDTVKKLLRDPNSPWVKYKWNMKLTK